MLPSAVPNARIMRYGYMSNWFGADAIRTNVTNLAQRLLSAIKRDRNVRVTASHVKVTKLTNGNQDNPSYEKRPLIFIAHCFGGLVVLQV
jgi:hypothetical protein